MSKHAWNVRGITPETMVRGIRVYRVARTLQSQPVSIDIHSYRQAMAFTGYFLERQRQSGSLDEWSLWRGALRSKHLYARGLNADNYEGLGRRVMVEAIIRGWRYWYKLPVLNPDGDVAYPLTPERPEPLLWQLLMNFQETIQYEPLRDYLEDKGYDYLINVFETGHKHRRPLYEPDAYQSFGPEEMAGEPLVPLDDDWYRVVIDEHEGDPNEETSV